MPRKRATSLGGSDLASKVLDFIKDNKDDMKSNSGARDAAENETIGDEDLANAIAFAVQEALAEQTVVLESKAGVAGQFVVAAVPAPVVVNPAFPLNLPVSTVKNLKYTS